MNTIDLELLDTLYYGKYQLENEIHELRKQKMNPVPEEEEGVIHAKLDTTIICKDNELRNIKTLIKLHLKIKDTIN
jgi:hypothetical protein